MVVSTLCRYIVKSPRLDGIYSIQCSVSPLFKCSFFWFLLLHHVPVAIVSVWAGKRCSLPRCLKSLFAPCKGFASWSKKISTFRFSSGSIFFAQPLHGEPRFVFTAQLKATAKIERTSKRLLGGSLVARSGLPLGGVLVKFKRLVTLGKNSITQCPCIQIPPPAPCVKARRRALRAFWRLLLLMVSE